MALEYAPVYLYLPYAPSKKRSLGVEDLDLYLSQPLSNVDGGRYHCSVTVSFCSLSSVTAV